MAIGPLGLVQTMNQFRVPREWEHVVCICAEDHGTKHTDDIYMKCRSCDKLKRFYGSHCRNCKQFYLMVFQHPVWVPAVNYCFGCCEEVQNYSNPKAVTIVPPEDKYRYPAQLKSAEELADELDDLLAGW